MPELTAEFRVTLDASIFIDRETPFPEYEAKNEDFAVSLNLVCPPPDKWDRLRIPIFPTKTVDVTVTKNEPASPPNNTREQKEYFRARRDSYRNAGLKVLNRAILFFVHELNHPGLHQIPPSQEVEKWEWIDETGTKSVGEPKIRFPLVHLDGLGISCFSEKHDDDLQYALENAINPELYQEILSDAQDAAYEGNLRRAVIELAIGCEVAVKQHLFGGDEVSEAAFAYVADRGRIPSVTKLICGGTERICGQNFHDMKNEHYQNIDHLFMCRNKVAHRGKAFYRDNDGKHEVSTETFEEWWRSVQTLIKWLETELGDVT